MSTARGRLICVTADHIERGAKRNPWHCPVALAINDARLRRAARRGSARVSRTQIEIGALTLVTPRSASRFIVAFDEGVDVKPFSFRLVLAERMPS